MCEVEKLQKFMTLENGVKMIRRRGKFFQCPFQEKGETQGDLKHLKQQSSVLGPLLHAQIFQ